MGWLFVSGSLVLSSWGQVLEISGVLPSDTTWGPNQAVLVKGDLTVPENITLTILPGCVIQFADISVDMEVLGVLDAQGTTNAPVTFQPAAGVNTWGGIFINGESPGRPSSLEYAVIEGGGSNFASSTAATQFRVLDASPRFRHCTFRNSHSNGLRMENSEAVLSDCVFTANAQDAVQMTPSCSPALSNNSATGNRFDGLRIDGGHILETNVWRFSNLPYLVDHDIQIDSGAALTIEAGAVIQFAGIEDDLIAAGKLTAVGASGNPIVFTSLNDEAANSWGGILFSGNETNASLLEYCELRHGGSNFASATQDAMIRCENASPLFRNCRMEASKNHGMCLVNSAAVISSVLFKGNPRAAVTMDTASFPVFTSVTAEGNGFDAIQVRSGSLTASGRWDYAELPYLLAGDVTLESGVTLTIDPATVIQTGDLAVDLLVKGTLHAVGGADQPILFTSMGDKPENRWGGILFTGSTANASVLEHCAVRHGGSNFASAAIDSMIRCESSSPTFNACRVEDSANAGISLIDSQAQLTSIHFVNNRAAALYMDARCFPVFTGITAEGNGYDALLIRGGTILAGGRWDYAEIPYLLDSDITLASGATLTIDPGTVVQSRDIATDFIIQGTLYAAGETGRPIVFTSLKDIPDNAWGGILFSNSGSDGSILKHCQIRYGGTNFASATVDSMIRCEASSPTLSDCWIANSHTNGLSLITSRANVASVRFAANANYAAFMDLQSFPQFTAVSAESNQFDGILILNGTMNSSGRWDYAEIPYLIRNDVVIAPEAMLTIDPGTELQFTDIAADLRVDGALWAVGTVSNPIRFTSLHRTPAPGSWGGIYFSSTTNNAITRLQHCVMEYGGSNFASLTQASMVFCDGASPALENCVFQYSNSDGIWIKNGSPVFIEPVIQNNKGLAAQIFPNAFPVIQDAAAVANRFNAIKIAGGSWTGSGEWIEPGIPYLISEDVEIAPEARITIAKGNTIQFLQISSDLLIKGRLDAAGSDTLPILFTSAQTVPARGHWGALVFTAGSSGRLSQAEVEYGGSNFASEGLESQFRLMAGADVTLENLTLRESLNYGMIAEATAATLTNLSFEDNTRGGLRGDQKAAVEITASRFTKNGQGVAVRDQAQLTLRGNVFQENTDALFTYGDESRIRFGNNQFLGNNRTGSVNFLTAASSEPGNIVSGDQAGLEIGSGELKESGALHALLGGYYEIHRSRTIAPTGSLQIRPGTFIALEGGDAGFVVSGFLGINGQINQPVQLAAPPTVPDATRWSVYAGILLQDEGKGSIRHAVIRNAGIGRAGVEARGLADVSLESCRFEYNQFALRVLQSARMTTAYSRFLNNGTALETNGQSGMDAAVQFSHIVGNQAGVNNLSPSINVNATFNWWGSANGPSGSGPGNGDSVSQGVLFEPWFTSEEQVPDQVLVAREVELHTPYSETVEKYGLKLYKFHAQAGRNLLCRLIHANASSRYHIFAALGYEPSPARYDRRSITPQLRPAYELLMTQTGEGDYYFLVFAIGLADSQETYQIQFDYVDQYVVSLSPTQGGNLGDVTLSLEGSLFQSGVEVRLAGPGGTAISAYEILVPDSTKLHARMNLRGAPIGSYNLEVKWPGGIAQSTFENAFQVTPGIGPRLEAELLAPNAIRPGRTYTLLIRYQNTGDADMTAPVLLLRSEADVPLGLDPDAPLETKPVRFLAVPREGPAGILAPGAEGSIAVYFQSGAANRISFSLEAIQDLNSLVAWDAPEWTAYVDAVGPTWGDYQDALATMATGLWSQGVILAGADELLARLLGPLQQKPGGEIHGRLVDEEYGHPQTGASILIQNISSSGIPAFSTTADTNAEGQFEFINLPSGIYSIEVNGYPGVNPGQINVNEGQIVSGVEWRVPYGGIIEGTVFEMPGRTPFEGVMLTLQDGLGGIRAMVADETGAYRFPALPAGLYSLEALHPSYAAKRYDGLQVWNGRALKEVDFLLEPSVYLNGVVQDADTGQPIANPMIYLKTPQGSLLPAWSFEDGTYSIAELAPGNYELRCQADGYQVLAPLAVTVPESGLNGLTIQMKRGAVCQGRVLDAAAGSPLENAILLFTNLVTQTSDTAQTNALGNFTVSRLTPGIHSVWINATGYELQIRMIEIQSGAANTLGDVLLPPGGSLTGRVLDADGITPLADSLVSAVSVDGVVLGMVMSDGQGGFAFHNLPQRSLTLSALLADYTFPRQTIQVNGNMDGITLIAASGKIAGTITAGTSALGVENAIIEAVPLDPGAEVRQGSMASSGADGQYELNHLVPGNYLLAVIAPGLGRMTQQVTLGDSALSLDFALPAESLVTGKIVSARTGDPVSDAVVLFKEAAGDPGLKSFSAGDGTFTMAGMAAGTYEVHVQAAGFPRYKQSGFAVLESGATPPLSITLPSEDQTVTGTIRDSASLLPLAGAVVIFKLDGLEAARSTASAEGVYQSTPLAVGSYQLDIIFGSQVAKDSVEVTDLSGSFVKDIALPLAPGAGFDPWPITPQFVDTTKKLADDPSASLMNARGFQEYLDGFLDWLSNTNIPADYRLFVTERSGLARDPRVMEMINHAGGLQNWNAIVKNPDAQCRNEAKNVGKLLAQSEYVYMDAWKAKGNANFTWLASGGEVGLQAAVLAGKIAELELAAYEAGAAAVVNGPKIIAAIQKLKEGKVWGQRLLKVLSYIEQYKGRLTFLKDARNNELTWRSIAEEFHTFLGLLAKLKPLMNMIKSEEFKRAFEPVLNLIGIVNESIKLVESTIDAVRSIRDNTNAASGRYHAYQLYVARAQKAFQKYLDCTGEKSPFPQPPTTPVQQTNSPVVVTRDPNEKTGPGGKEAVISGQDPLTYTIFFENTPEATASVQQVILTDDLSNQLDWTSFELSEVAIGGRIIPIPAGHTDHYQRVAWDEYAVDIEARLNPYTGRARWTLTLIDPETGAIPLDGTAGFLPPNDSATGRGEGHVTFRIDPAAGLQPGTAIRNQASIVFDANAAIVTNETIHTLATQPPNPPEALSPVAGAYSPALTPVLQASEYAHPLGTPRKAAQFEIREYTFGTLVWESGSLAPTSQTKIPLGPLQSGQNYEWRVRYQDANEQWSEWSEFAWFTTKAHSLFGDLNQDGFVNRVDLLILIHNWHGSSAADLNQDGRIDRKDLLLFSDRWKGTH